MKCRCFIVFALFLLTQLLEAQTTQRGKIMEMNSGNKPIAGVSVMAIGAVPTDSDGEGNFQLFFSKIRPGSHIIINQVYKNGYEIVNENDIKEWVLSSSYVLDIVLCKKGALEASRRNFYDIGQDQYYGRYTKAKKELETLMSESKISEDDYTSKLDAVVQEYQQAMGMLDYYADKFSRINKDQISEIDAKALALLEEGKIEEAIKVYEDAQILDKFKDLTAQRDTANYNVKAYSNALLHEIKILEQKGDILSRTKIDSIYGNIYQQDSLNYEIVASYLHYLLKENREHHVLFPVMKQALLISPIGGNDEANIISLINNFMEGLGQGVPKEAYKIQLEELKKQKEELKKLEELKK